MFPQAPILKTWKKFDQFAMETLTKRWNYNSDKPFQQRSVSQMKEQRERFGVSGNCFDLAIWLLDEFKNDGIEAYPIGHEIQSEDAHAAVIALDENGRRFLCDLGDQWLLPILVDANDEDFSGEKLSGFFPGADIQLKPSHSKLEVYYHRPNGRFSVQAYDLQPVDGSDFEKAAERSQNHLNPHPLVECRIPYKKETAHWEFDEWKSFISSAEGLHPEPPAASIEEWAIRINEKTGYNKEVAGQVLREFKTVPSSLL
ncbi:hypothetical protein [Jeotgalibacillus campisalis]|uniref:Uncharacterized protein n=1 Tax=Jeotgalibacillus campisalis TaxID=220754 RepID=A0A0C2SG31_9BACL|nr:hypothetical protein [Jeotgalibacillus campisalis]KIL52894.1 hypothetical protein KR50_02230 [Jeotgalibacillus campisalis]